MTINLSFQEGIGYAFAMAKDQRAEKVTEIWMEAIGLFFRLRAMGKELGAVSEGNASYWGLLNTIVTKGPTTVPDIARMRPVSRQHIQAMANEMEAQGLVTFVENPRHKRSKLVKATAKGEAFYKKQSGLMHQQASEMAGDLSLEELETATRVLAELRGALEQRQTTSAQ